MAKKKNKDEVVNKSLQQKLDDAVFEHDRRKGKARKRRTRKSRK